MHKTFLLKFLFFFTFSILIMSCNLQKVKYEDVYIGGDSSDTSNGTSESQKVNVDGIFIGSNYVELKKMPESSTIPYEISAVAKPINATNKELTYSINKVGEVSNKDNNLKSETVNPEIHNDGMVILPDLGDYEVTIKSQDNPDISEKVLISVHEGKLTPLNLNNGLTLYGKYTVSQYKVGYDDFMNLNINNSYFSIDLKEDEDGNGYKLNYELYANGLRIYVFDDDKISFKNKSFDEIGKEIATMLNMKVSNNIVSIELKGKDYPVLVKNDVIKENETLSLLLSKKEDINPAQVEINQNNSKIKVTELDVLNPTLTDYEGKKQHYKDYDAKNGTKFVISANVKPLNASNIGVKYEALTPEIATINAFGIVSLKKIGLAKFKIYPVEDKNLAKNVYIDFKDTAIRVENVTVDTQLEKDVLIVGKKYEFIGKVTPENAQNQQVIFYSPQSDIVKVESNGDITPLKPGMAFIYAYSTDFGNKSAVRSMIVKEDELNRNVKIEAITGIPKKIFIKEGENYNLNMELLPKYAANKDVKIKIVAPDDKIIEISNKTIKGLKVGVAKVEISPVNNPELIKETEVNVDGKDEQITTIKDLIIEMDRDYIYVNDADLIINVKTVPEITNKYNTIEAINIGSRIQVVPNTDVPNSFRVIGITEDGDSGPAQIQIESGNGVVKTVDIKVKKAMKIQGQYKLKNVELRYSGKSLELDKANPLNFKLFDGEMAIKRLPNNNLSLTGRVQYSPNKDSDFNYFTNKRYFYFANTINNPNNEDLQEIYTEKYLDDNRFRVIDEKTIEYRHLDNGLTANMVFEKYLDEEAVIENKQLFKTPIDIVNDYKSSEGYYHLDFFYHKTYQRGAFSYTPAFSGNCSDAETFKSMLKHGMNDCGGFTTFGGNGPGGSVAYFKGEFVIKADRNGNNLIINSTLKDQKQGHKFYDNALSQYNEIYKYFHLTFDPISINLTDYSKNKFAIFKNVKTVMHDWYNNKQHQRSEYAIRFNDDGESFDFEIYTYPLKYSGMDRDIYAYFKFRKISDKYMPLTTSKYAGDVGDRNPASYPSEFEVKAIENKTGNLTAIK